MKRADESWRGYRNRRRREKSPSRWEKGAAKFVASFFVGLFQVLRGLLAAIFSLLAGLAG